jgi:hypothetical protein
MAIDLFDTRAMIAALEQMLPVKTFFLDRFFSNTETHQTEYVDIDIQKGKRRLAAFVNPRLEGKTVQRLGYSTRSYKPPYVKPKMVTTAEDLLKRAMGQHIYNEGMSGEQFAQAQLGKDLATLDEMIVRREEWMAAQSLLTGKLVVTGDGVSDEIDFGMDASHLVTLAGADLWSASTATPLEDLEDWAELIAKDSGLTVDTIIMGKDAARAFRNHPDVQKKLDNLRIFIGQIAPSRIVPGAQYIGTVNSVADIWVYNEWYTDDWSNAANPVVYPMMDAKKVLLGCSSARCTRHYGAIQDLDAMAVMARFPKSWKENDPSARLVMVQSAPLTVPHQIDGFITATVVG